MQIDITFKNIDSSDALKDYASKRFSKLDRYIERPSDVHVVLSVEKRRHQADITLNADGVMINAVETTDDMYSAIDMVMDKLERQVKKHKEKIQGKKGQTKVYFEGTGAPGGEAAKPRIIHEKDYFVKPMSVEEAALQMDMAPNDFIIFQNTDSNQINLIYKRQDGDLGLVEPLI